jgi:threonyl-tRNA synthetase
MKLLLFHVDSFEYWTTRPTKLAEENPRENNRKENATVVFTAVEPGDTEKVNAAVDEIKKVQGWMHSAEVFIYPYAHLSENLSSKDEAIAVMNSLCEKLGCERAPFGWYKKFTLSVKGHPMSEFSRRI